MNTLHPRGDLAPVLAGPRRSASRTLAFAVAVATAGTAAAQVTDPAVITSYGAACGVAVTGNDTILGNGSHAVHFDVTVGPNAPALLALGFQAVDMPLPGTPCHLLAEPLDVWFAPANAMGHADFVLPIPAAAIGRLFVQAATFDAALTIETSQGLDVLFPGQSPTADPSAQVAYPCVFYSDLVWNYGGDGVGNVSGRVWWPSATCQSSDGPPNNLPMVVFLHGNGMTFTDHDNILAHLARNGFVVASVANGSYMGGSNEGRAREAISYLNGMHAFWGWESRLTDDVAFAGHSRGGEAAITAARLLRDNPGMMHQPYDVEAVLSIAPTDGGGDGSDPREVIDGLMTEGFLAIYGSHDPDVRGVRLEDPIGEPERTAFAIWDRAGSEGSIEGLLLPANNVTKSLIFVEGATHRGFLDGCNVIAGGSIGCTAHRDLAKGYMNAFLRWRVLNQSAYKPYFTGAAVPTKVRVAEVTTQAQFRGNPVRVLDNFEQGGWAVNTRGGSVVTGAGIAVIDEDDAWQLDPSAPHDTSALRVKWSGVSSYLGFSLPAQTIPLVGEARDVGNYQYLSLRVGQDYLDAWNVAGEDQDFRVRIYTGFGWSSYVVASDHGRVPYPTYFFTHPYPYPAGDFTKTAMATIRIPLSAFANADLSDLRNVYLYFDVPGHTAGSLLIDSLEFSN
jgi:acetyl esterase/lipase